MTQTAPEQAPEHDQTSAPWDTGESQMGPFRPAYPEVENNPHNHTYTWSPKLPDGSMLVIRSQTAEGLVTSVEALSGALVARLRAAWGVVAQGGAPASQGPPLSPAAQQPQFQAQAQQQFNQQPAQQLPQQGGQAPAAWQNAGAPQQPQQGQWGGQQQNGGGQAQGSYPAPQGWYRMNVPYPGGKDQLHALAQQYGIPKGNPSKGGKYNFWSAPTKAWYCAPDVAQAFAQFQPVPA